MSNQENKNKQVFNSPFAPNGVVWEGQKDFDTEYVSIEIRDKVVKTGEGENDFIIEKVVHETRKPIQEVIDGDASSVGVYNIIRQVIKSEDSSLLPADDGSCNVDMVGAPETLMEVKALGQKVEKQFKALPNELTEGRDMRSFVENMSQEKFDAFIKAMSDRANAQKEVKKDE